jgi:hypothetical protein
MRMRGEVVHQLKRNGWETEMAVNADSVVVPGAAPSSTGRSDAARDLRGEFKEIATKPLPENVITPHDGHTFVPNSAEQLRKGKAA